MNEFTIRACMVFLLLASCGAPAAPAVPACVAGASTIGTVVATEVASTTAIVTGLCYLQDDDAEGDDDDDDWRRAVLRSKLGFPDLPCDEPEEACKRRRPTLRRIGECMACALFCEQHGGVWPASIEDPYPIDCENP